MSDAESATTGRAPAQQLISELKVSGHLMSLDQGLFCIVQAPSPSRDPARGLPGVRISLPPNPQGGGEGVTIRSFRDDGWLGSNGDAALVRVDRGPAQVLVTVYQAPDAEAAPNLQVLRLVDPAAAGAAGPASRPDPQPAAPEVVDVVAHIQGRGDVGGLIGQWVCEPGGKRWIEGFALAPLQNVSATDIEYQAVLGRGWLSPWVEGGQFCGSRGMALPLLGIRVRLRGKAAEAYTCSYAASFVDGTEIGPVGGGEPCESENLAAMEAFRVMIQPRGRVAVAAPAISAKPQTSAPPAAPPRAKAAPPRAAAKKALPPARNAAPPPKRGKRR
ncbi:MAG TPA: hypothetical protein VHS58_04555 [Acetobacteraceae bacterium]|nr:hypothetical protein [Acetobacteraceae bacterium]